MGRVEKIFTKIEKKLLVGLKKLIEIKKKLQAFSEKSRNADQKLKEVGLLLKNFESY